MTSERPTDDALWNALTEGDQRAFSEVYQRYYRILYSYGYKLVSNADLVEDAIQELFVDLWRLRQNLSTAESVKFYLFRSLRRQLYRLHEKEKRLVDVYALPSTSYQAADQQLIDQEKEEKLMKRLTHLLQQLPQRQLEVVTLRFYENFKTHEIAEIMGITDKSVRNTLHKALTHLREHSQDLMLILSFLLLFLLI